MLPKYKWIILEANIKKYYNLLPNSTNLPTITLPIIQLNTNFVLIVKIKKPIHHNIKEPN